MTPSDPDAYHTLPPELRQKIESAHPEMAQSPAQDQRSFTWHNARQVAIIVRDGLLMIVKGLERVFEIGKK